MYLSFSGGKDSTASAIILHEMGIHTTVIYSHFYFDKSRNIPAILPEHDNFIHNVIFPKLKEWGCEIIEVEPDTDYITEFMKIKKRGKHIGDVIGFPLPVRSSCWVNSKMKVKAIKQAEEITENDITYIGIAYDETERYNRLCIGNKKSILFETKTTEKMAMELCNKYNLLSPIYKNQQRDGCWFCNQMSIASSAYIKNNYPDLVEELIKLEKFCKYSFARNSQSVTDFYSREYKKRELYGQLTIEGYTNV